MGFFGLDTKAVLKTANKVVSKIKAERDKAVFNRAQCSACPLNHADVLSPKMQPLGDEAPMIYLLGPAPSKEADKRDEPFTGKDWAFIRKAMPADVHKHLRFNNVIRCHPGNDKKKIDLKDAKAAPLYVARDPVFAEIESCRPSVIADIEASKPEAIFSFGRIPLRWGADETHPSRWQGRRIPVQIGSHKCWLYPFNAPHDVYKERRWDGYNGDWEIAFKLYMKRAVKEVQAGLPEPFIADQQTIWEGVEFITGHGGDADIDLLEDFLKEAATFKYNGFDYETNAIRPYNDPCKLLTASVSYDGKALAFPLDHRESPWTPKQRKRVQKVFEDWLWGPSIKCAHQLAFELEWTGEHIDMDLIHGTKWEDTLSQAYIINETQGMLALEILTVQYFGFNIKEQNLINRNDLDNEPLANVLKYNALDAKWTEELFYAQADVLDELGQQDQYEHQRQRVKALTLTTLQGVPIDREERARFKKPWLEKQKTAEDALAGLRELSKFASRHGHEYRPSAPEDLALYMQDRKYKMGTTKSGKDTGTDIKTLQRYMHDPVIEHTVAYRKASKLLSTYVSSIEDDADTVFDDGLLHPIISATKVETWRTSSEEPNIQNWPKRGPNVVIRKCIAPGKTKRRMKIVAVDYAGIQARNVAMESQDPVLVQAFIDGYDIHADWTTTIANLYPKWAPPGFFSKEKETASKAFKAARGVVKNQFVFPNFFGARPSEKMSINFGEVMGTVPVPVDILAEAQGQFWNRFSGVKEWQDRLIHDFNKLGYVKALSGFRRHAPVGFNQIINSGIQSDESIIVLSAMCALSELDWRMYQPMFEIHDDLTFLLPEDELEDRIDVIVSEMVKPRFEWIDPVPLVVEVSVGDNWADLKEIGHYENVGTDGKYRKIKG